MLKEVRERVLAFPGARRVVRAVLLLLGGFRGEAITLRASALTYEMIYEQPIRHCELPCRSNKGGPEPPWRTRMTAPFVRMSRCLKFGNRAASSALPQRVGSRT